MKFAIIPVTPYQQNCSLIFCEKTNKAAFIDPGGDLELLKEAQQELGVDIEKILITHGHIDHAGAAQTLADFYSVEIEGPHRDDKFLLDDLGKQGPRLGIKEAKAFEPSRWMEHNDEVTVGELNLSAIHCPGHTPGHVVFYHEPMAIAFVGDVLFQGSIGRTDFPRGNHQDLLNSIRERLWPLGDDVRFVPGHGPMSSFGFERQQNPFVADSLFEKA
jgi:glyoxylase-like metal-dependent hydrolase (beta-lactamase superfamily II)